MLGLSLAALLDSAFKGVVLCLAALAAASLLRRSSAAARHLVWRLAFAGLLALPVLSALLPAWRVTLPAGAPAAVLAPAVAHGPVQEVLPPPAAVAPVSRPEVTTPAQPRTEPLSRQAVAFGVWLAGAVSVLAALAVALLRLAWQRRLARPVEDESWLRLLARARADLGIRRPVLLIEGDDRAMPMTWGWRRPVVLLPAGAEDWPESRRRAVLLHELAHVVRGDSLTQLAAEVARALHWWNPLVWIAARRLRLESEHASDDQVLTAGARATDYAGDLLDLARSFRPVRAAAPAGLAMARPSQLAGRLAAVLDKQRNRGRVSRRLAFPAWLAAAGLVLPLASLAPAAAAPAARAEAEKEEKSWFDGFFSSFDFRDANSFQIRDGDRRLRIESKGKLKLTEDWTAIASLSQGATLRIEEERDGTERRLDVTAGSGGKPVYRLRVDGKERALDATGRKWVRAMLLAYVRGTGYEADKRVAWFLRRQGPEGVLAETSHLLGDYVRRLYLTELFTQTKQTKLQPPVLERALRLAGREIGSDYELAETLLAAAGSQTIPEPAAVAYAEAAQGVGSDYEARRALAGFVEKARLTPRSLTAVLDAARGIGSDYELAELLVEVARKSQLADPAVRNAYAEAVAEIGSDYEARRALSAIVERGDLSPEAVATVLQSAEHIGSDYELAELLVGIAGRYTLSGATRDAYQAVARGIGSDHDIGRVQRALGQQAGK